MAVVLKQLCRGQRFWEEKVHNLIKGLIISPIPPAYLKAALLNLWVTTHLKV